MTSTTPLASSPIASFDLVVLDTPEPRKLAEFYCALLGWRIVREDDDWVTIRGDSSASMAFQLAPDLVPPTWPDPAIPQQSHLDVTVADLDIAERQVLGPSARGRPECRSVPRGSGRSLIRRAIRSASASRSSAIGEQSRCSCLDSAAGGGAQRCRWHCGPVRFTPLTPTRLTDELATWIESLLPGRTRVGIDGATEVGATGLADAVAERLRTRGRPVVRASTTWWWRPASLRLEFGHQDVDMLLTGWVDSGSLGGNCWIRSRPAARVTM